MTYFLAMHHKNAFIFEILFFMVQQKWSNDEEKRGWGEP